MVPQQLAETLKYIQENMATKEDINCIKSGNVKLQEDVKEIKSSFRQKIADLERKVEELTSSLNATTNAVRAKKYPYI